MATAAASKEEEAPATRFAKDHLKAFVERIERLEEEKKTIADDIRDVYAEAKGTGFDVKALRTIVRLRKQDADERREHETILETYMRSFSQVATGPAFKVRAPLPIHLHASSFRSWLELTARATGDDIFGQRICSILVRSHLPAT